MKWALLSLLIPFCTFGVEEKFLPKIWSSQIRLWHEKSDVLTFKNSSGLLLRGRYYRHPRAKGIVVLLPGRTMTTLVYSETSYDLHQQGYSIFSLDHQGQGESSKIVPGSPKGDVIHFDDYADDLQQFLETFVLPNKGKLPLYLVGHSMGGAIGFRHMSKYPDVFDKAVLVAPFFGLYLLGIPGEEAFTREISDALNFVGLGAMGIPGYRGPSRTFDAKNRQTTSSVRYTHMQSLRGLNPAFDVGSPTFRWMSECLDYAQNIYKNPPAIRTPLFVLLAGDDKVVKNLNAAKLCRALSHCDLDTISGARHEIFLEKDEFREEALKRIIRYL